MKVIGLIGGMSWESTAHYYRLLNQEVRRRLGGQHSARILLYSVDFQPIETLQAEGRWEELARLMEDAALRLAGGGADFLVLATHTMHKVALRLGAAVGLPLLHIADATAERLVAGRVGRAGLLGTRYTMEEAFYRERLTELHGIEVLVPPPEDREIVHRVIFDELCLGKASDVSRREYLRIIDALAARGAQGVILGCTEIGQLVESAMTNVPIFDTAEIHALAAVDLALKSPPAPVPPVLK